ncbi:MAG TPA: hypothetical protein VNW95_00035 [Mucilaginibacter sp.]|jgi:hypothetical protein|nr:hypothetical protein [Mucilaginibacter sp.]
MKKLALIIVVGLVINACKQPKSNQKVSNVLLEPTSGVTLNGIDSAAARAMIDTFKKYKGSETAPLPTSVWFSKETIHSIDSLLHAEIVTQKKSDSTRKDTTDGIRLYFACDPTVLKPHLKTTVLFVSTFDSLIYPKGKSPHRDYYSHNASFLAAKTGEVSHDKNLTGALLYQTKYTCPPKPANCSISPDHLITCEQAHRWVQNHGKNSINTTSEWFDLKLLDYFDKEIHNNKNNPDGLRIYFAFRDKDDDHPSIINRNIFLFITTKDVNKVHTDYFECEEIHHIVGDNGELCPDVCN